MENTMKLAARDVRTGMQIECPDGQIRKVAWTSPIWWKGAARGKHGREICTTDNGYTVRYHGSAIVVVVCA